MKTEVSKKTIDPTANKFIKRAFIEKLEEMLKKESITYGDYQGALEEFKLSV